MARCKWSQEDDTLLRAAVAKYGPRNWKLIAETLKTNGNIVRTDVQCSQRWLKVLQPGLKKGAWQPEEDQKLRALVMRERDSCIGDALAKSQNTLKLDWVVIAQQIQGRTSKSVRERWLRYLDPDIKKDAWTPEEDRILLTKEKELGHKWATIARLDSLQGRTGEAVKMRWKQLMKENKSNCNMSVPSKVLGHPIRPTVKREAPFAVVPVTLAVGSSHHTCEQRSAKRPRLAAAATTCSSKASVCKLPASVLSAQIPTTLGTPSSADSILDEWMATDMKGEEIDMTQAMQVINETDEDMDTDVDSLRSGDGQSSANESDAESNESIAAIDAICADTPRSIPIDSTTTLKVLSELGSLLDLADFRTGTTPRPNSQSRLTRSNSLRAVIANV
jgi:hypothetical protein